MPRVVRVAFPVLEDRQGRVSWDANRIRQYVWDNNWVDDSGPAFNAACVLLASAIIGPNANRIARFLELKRDEVRTFGKRLRANEIWKGRKVYGDWFDEQYGGINFCLDINIALGLMEKVSE